MSARSFRCLQFRGPYMFRPPGTLVLLIWGWRFVLIFFFFFLKRETYDYLIGHLGLCLKTQYRRSDVIKWNYKGEYNVLQLWCHKKKILIFILQCFQNDAVNVSYFSDFDQTFLKKLQQIMIILIVHLYNLPNI